MITMFVNEERLTDLLYSPKRSAARSSWLVSPLGSWVADWLESVPTTMEDWNDKWHTAIPVIVEALMAHGGVVAAQGLPAGWAADLRFERLADPVGLQVWAQIDTDTTTRVWSARICGVTYQQELLFAEPGNLVRAACELNLNALEVAAAFVRQLAADLNSDLRAVQTVFGSAPDRVPAAPHTA